MPEPETRYKLLVASIFLIFGALCITSLHLRELWTDEGYRLMIMDGGRTWSQQMAATDVAGPREVLLAVGPELYQPLFYLFGNLLFHLLGGVSVTALRVANTAFLLFGLWGLLRLSRPWPPFARIILLFLFAGSGSIFMHVMQVREYPLYIALSIWSVAFYFQLFNAPPSSWRPLVAPWAGYVITGILGYYTHTFFLFVLLAQCLFIPFRSHHRKAFALKILSALVIVAVAALPWLLFLDAHFPYRANSTWTTPTGPRQLLPFLNSLRIGFRMLLTYFDSRPRFTPLIGAMAKFLDTWAILYSFIFLAAITHLAKQRRNADPLALFGALSVLIFFVFQLGWYFMRDDLVVFPRYFIGYFLGLTILAAYGFYHLYTVTRSTRTPFLLLRGFMALTVISVGVQLWQFRIHPYADTSITPKCGWLEISTKLSARVHAGDGIIYYHPLQAWTFSEVFRTPVVEANTWAAAEGRLPATPTIWALDTFVEQPLWRKTHNALLAAGYRQSDQEKLGCLAVLTHYQKTANGF